MAPKEEIKKKEKYQQTSIINPKHAIWSQFGKLNEVI